MKNNFDNWYKLDNAANIFPAVSTVSVTNVFRFTARLYEDVSKEILQKAVELALDEMPFFKVKMHKGFFWYYFEQNNEVPIVKEEHNYPCRRIDKYSNNGYLFEVTYFGKYIHIEFFHALCDGTGASDFLSRVVTKYISLAHKDKIPHIPDAGDSDISKSARSEDSFMRVTRGKSVKGKNIIEPRSYIPSSTLTQNGEINVIKGIMKLDDIKRITKEKGVTITALFASLIIYSIYLECYRFEPKNKPIDVSTPVNLRKYFHSDTARNFFTTMTVGVNFYKKNYSFDEVLQIIKEKLNNELDEDKLYSKIMYNVKKQRNLLLRFIPLPLKNAVLKLIYMKGEKGFTASFSNMGFFVLPKEVEPYVERFEFSMSPTAVSHYKVSACSFKDTTVFSFTTNIENKEVQKRFFTMLRELGAEAVICCNEPTEEMKRTILEKKNEAKRKK